jgi:hypothetical protein
MYPSNNCSVYFIVTKDSVAYLVRGGMVAPLDPGFIFHWSVMELVLKKILSPTLCFSQILFLRQ